MAKFHINEQGDVKPCSASKSACRFGGSELHFETEVEARAEVERRFSAQQQRNAELMEQREAEFVRTVSAGTHSRVNMGTVPREIRKIFENSIRGKGVARAVLKDFHGNYKLVSYSRENDSFSSWTAPATKDVPRLMKWQAWSMSLHPKGPKIEYRCAACGVVDSKRLADFSHKARGDYRVRCAGCGQLNRADIIYEAG